jgi:hypothetical protein
MWAPPLYGTSYNTPTSLVCRVQTGDGALSQEKLFTDTSTNAKGAYLRVKFGEFDSDIGKWHSGSYAYDAASVAFKIEAPQGTIIDLSFSYQLASTSASYIALTTSSASAGVICLGYLDSVATGGGAGSAQLVPVNELCTIAEAF